MRIYKSKKGHLCAENDGKNLHSLYNPQREAARFIEQAISGSPSIVILLGAGLGYIQQNLLEKYPQIKLLSLYHDDEIFSNTQIKSENIRNWYPSCGTDPAIFLQKNVPEALFSKLTVIEWEPSAQIFPKRSLELNHVLKNVIQELNGNIQTTAYFGKQWIRNTLTNFLSTDNYCLPELPRAAYLIASSGPNLEKSLGAMKKYRDKYILLALPSSLKALCQWGIKPDIQISTDPGFYSGMHLQHLFSNVPLAQPFTAGRGNWRHSVPLYLLNQSTPFESDLFLISGLSHHRIPSNGTVSGTALELSSSKAETVYFAGLDLCFSDIRSHVSPHTFETLLQSDADRMTPFQSISYARAFPAQPDFQNKIRTGRSLDTYKNWFSRYAGSKALKIKRLNPSPITIDNVSEGRLSELASKKALPEMSIKLIHPLEQEKRKKIVGELISLWIKQIEMGERDELFYYIDTENFTKGKDNQKALSFLNDLKDLYG